MHVYVRYADYDALNFTSKIAIFHCYYLGVEVTNFAPQCSHFWNLAYIIFPCISVETIDDSVLVVLFRERDAIKMFQILLLINQDITSSVIFWTLFTAFILFLNNSRTSPTSVINCSYRLRFPQRPIPFQNTIMLASVGIWI